MLGGNPSHAMPTRTPSLPCPRTRASSGGAGRLRVKLESRLRGIDTTIVHPHITLQAHPPFRAKNGCFMAARPRERPRRAYETLGGPARCSQDMREFHRAHEIFGGRAEVSRGVRERRRAHERLAGRTKVAEGVRMMHPSHIVPRSCYSSDSAAWRSDRNASLSG